MEYEKSDYKMPQKSALASSQLEYDQTVEEMYKDQPEMLKLMMQVRTGKVSPEEGIKRTIDFYQNLTKNG